MAFAFRSQTPDFLALSEAYYLQMFRALVEIPAAAPSSEAASVKGSSKHRTRAPLVLWKLVDIPEVC